jgi:hypothetical protein
MIAVMAARVSGVYRWGVLIALAAVCGGCPRPPLTTETRPRDGGIPMRPSVYFATNRNIDLLFLIDDSSSMRLSQDNLRRNFPVLMRQLENLPGGLPNVHVAVVSSDMGAGDGSVAGCNTTGGKKGIFQNAPHDACPATGLAPGATYISNIAGVANYTGKLEDVFTCIAALGQSGCGFEHQFAAVTRALGVDGRAAPAENAGFLRPDALLAVVMITNEDDCSAKAGVPLYDTSSNTNITSQLGPPTNFRCNEFGHLCDGAHPNRRAPGNDVNASVFYDSCTSNETEGYLLAVRDTADRIKSLKGDDGQIMVAAITGPQAPYAVRWKEPNTPDTSCGAASCPWPETAHSCIAADGSFADPAVRIAELVGHFGDNGRLTSICDDDFAPALGAIADNISRYVNAPCIVGRIAKQPGTTRDDCTVTDADTRARVASCDETGGAGECWRLVPGGDTCSGVSIVVQADGQDTQDVPGNLTIRCTMCVPGVPDPAVGCP